MEVTFDLPTIFYIYPTGVAPVIIGEVSFNKSPQMPVWSSITNVNLYPQKKPLCLCYSRQFVHSIVNIL